MATPVEFGQYSSVARWAGNAPAWVPGPHQARIQSYRIYKEIYWSHLATTYKVMNRGLDADDEPVYVPSSRIMIETLNRYIGNKLTFQVDPEIGTPEQQLAVKAAFENLFRRERFASRYNANKRDGLIKGDWLWHIVADPEKEEGRRLSLLPVEPDSYFPTYEDEIIEGGDPEKLVQVRLVELVQVGDETQARVQLYDRTVDETGTIYSSLTMWKSEEWFAEDKAPVATILPPTPLPAVITAMPVYHIPNFTEVGQPFGSSEMRGLEVLQAALNQGVTDEDLALALDGLGVYATDQPGSPVDPVTGQPRAWYIYPGAVIENSKGLHRVPGLTSTAPYDSHLARLEHYMGDASGASEAAKGRVEVQEAESGIALLMRLSPILAKADEKDQTILDVHAQMFHDLLHMWLPEYEGVRMPPEMRVYPVLGDKLPVNRQAEANLVAGLVLGGIMSAASARNYLIGKGFVDMFDPTEGDLVLAERTALAAADQGTEPVADREAIEVDPDA